MGRLAKDPEVLRVPNTIPSSERDELPVRMRMMKLTRRCRQKEEEDRLAPAPVKGDPPWATGGIDPGASGVRSRRRKGGRAGAGVFVERVGKDRESSGSGVQPSIELPVISEIETIASSFGNDERAPARPTAGRCRLTGRARSGTSLTSASWPERS